MSLDSVWYLFATSVERRFYCSFVSFVLSSNLSPLHSHNVQFCAGSSQTTYQRL